MHCPMRRGLLQAGAPVVVPTQPSCTSTPAAHLRHSCMMGLAMNPFHSTGCTRHKKGGRHTECQRASCQPMSPGQRGATAWLCHCPPVSRQLLLVATAAGARGGCSLQWGAGVWPTGIQQWSRTPWRMGRTPG